MQGDGLTGLLRVAGGVKMIAECDTGLLEFAGARAQLISFARRRSSQFRPSGTPIARRHLTPAEGEAGIKLHRALEQQPRLLNPALIGVFQSPRPDAEGLQVGSSSLFRDLTEPLN